MLKFILTKETEQEAVYNYFPENTGTFGTISCDKSTGKCSIISLHKDDRHQRYAMKLFKKLREYASTGSFEKEGLIAWY